MTTAARQAAQGGAHGTGSAGSGPGTGSAPFTVDRRSAQVRPDRGSKRFKPERGFTRFRAERRSARFLSQTGAMRLRLVAVPLNPVAGQPVQLRVVGDSPTGPLGYRWDLSGDGDFALNTGAIPNSLARFATPGPHRVAVRVITAATARRTSLIILVAKPAASNAVRLVPRRSPRVTRAVVRRALAHATADPAVAIADFQFTPGSTTVHVGDTITWTNSGPSPHTATANDGSFNTGTLQKGQSGSHTFTRAGTFSYFCTIHPYMKGTVVVLAAATSTQPSGGSGRTSKTGSSTASRPASGAATTNSGSSATGTAPNTNSNLPQTGLDLTPVVLVGLAFGAVGTVLRRKTS
jgi:plastocyanin